MRALNVDAGPIATAGLSVSLNRRQPIGVAVLMQLQ
jgi:hypothetical protein